MAKKSALKSCVMIPGSCSYANFNTTEIFGSASSWIHQREKCNSYCETLHGEKTELCWTRGYFVSTVGRDEEVVREYIRHQEAEDRRVDQLQLV